MVTRDFFVRRNSVIGRIYILPLGVIINLNMELLIGKAPLLSVYKPHNIDTNKGKQILNIIPVGFAPTEIIKINVYFLISQN